MTNYTDEDLNDEGMDPELAGLWNSLSRPEKIRAIELKDSFQEIQGYGGPATTRNDWFDAVQDIIATRHQAHD